MKKKTICLAIASSFVAGGFAAGAHAQETFTEQLSNAVSEGKLLMVDVLRAEYLERQRLDQQQFHRLLTRVVDDPVGSFPEMALANQVARVRAKYLLDREADWF